MKAYKKTFQQVWMDTDSKPKGKMKQILSQKVRAELKVELLKEIKDVKVRS